MDSLSTRRTRRNTLPKGPSMELSHRERLCITEKLVLVVVVVLVLDVVDAFLIRPIIVKDWRLAMKIQRISE